MTMTTAVIPTGGFDFGSLQNSIPYGPQYQSVLDAAPASSSFLTPIWSWITFDVSHMIITLLAIVLFINLVRNEFKFESRIGLYTALIAACASLWGIALKFNPWLGALFTTYSLWFLTQASRFNNIDNEEDVEVPTDVPSAVPQPTQPSVYTGVGNFNSYVAPSSSISTGAGLGLNLR